MPVSRPKTVEGRKFAYAAPRTWSSLRQCIRNADSLAVFKRRHNTRVRIFSEMHISGDCVDVFLCVTEPSLVGMCRKANDYQLLFYYVYDVQRRE